jgi:hypothetical protein
MAVSRRLRFEILRRDNHACRYCGRNAPDIRLTVDHVTPVALGGTDHPSNLAAACEECNSGKTSVHTAGPVVADVAQDALRWAAAMKTAMDTRAADIEQAEAYCDTFKTEWDQWTVNGHPSPLPSTWYQSLAKWHEIGVPHAILRDAVRRAMAKPGLTGHDSRFRYAAGIIWKALSQAQSEIVQQSAGAAVCTCVDSMVEEDDDCPLSMTDDSHGDLPAKPMTRRELQEREEAWWSQGWEAGIDKGHTTGWHDARRAIEQASGLMPEMMWYLSLVVDHNPALGPIPESSEVVAAGDEADL